MKTTITHTATVAGITFQYHSRGCGDLITIKGKPGFVFTRDGSDPLDAGKPTGLFHGNFRPAREDEPGNPYGVFEEAPVEGVSLAEYMAATADFPHRRNPEPVSP